MNLGDIFKSAAPTIATILGGPLAGAAVDFLAGKLGTEKTADAVQQTIAGFTPADTIRLKELDVQFQEFMADNGIALERGQQEINKIYAQSNRGKWVDLFMAGWMPYLGWVGGFGIGYQFLLRPIINGTIFAFGGNYAFPTLEIQDLIALVTMLLGQHAIGTFGNGKKNGG